MQQLLVTCGSTADKTMIVWDLSTYGAVPFTVCRLLSTSCRVIRRPPQGLHRSSCCTGSAAHAGCEIRRHGQGCVPAHSFPGCLCLPGPYRPRIRDVRLCADIKRRETGSYLLATAGNRGITLWTLEPMSGSLAPTKVRHLAAPCPSWAVFSFEDLCCCSGRRWGPLCVGTSRRHARLLFASLLAGHFSDPRRRFDVAVAAPCVS